jgi:hypothetical protein
MTTISATMLLTIWENGVGQPPVRRALLLLAPFFGDQELAELPIGTRNAMLLMVREWLFGTRMDCVVHCPQCATRLEFTLSTTDVRTLAPTTTVHQLEFAGQRFTFRLPTSADLLALNPDTATSRHLIERCLLAAPATASTEALAAVAAAMVQADPLLDLQIALRCPECDHTWMAPFDVMTFVWREVDSWAQRLLRDVHTLAKAYGWCERDILALSPRRRAWYLRLVHYERSTG